MVSIIPDEPIAFGGLLWEMRKEMSGTKRSVTVGIRLGTPAAGRDPGIDSDWLSVTPVTWPGAAYLRAAPLGWKEMYFPLTTDQLLCNSLGLAPCCITIRRHKFRPKGD